MSNAYKGGEGDKAWQDVVGWHKKQPMFGAAAAKKKRKKGKKPTRFSRQGISDDLSSSYKKSKR